MAHQQTYGSMLRLARERKRMTVSVAAARLRVRPDIIRAIESADYDKMPPRGYARNMIAAYAKLVGLDSNEIVEMYLDGLYSQEISSRNVETARNIRRSRPTHTDPYAISPMADKIQSNPGYRQQKASEPLRPGRERLSLYEERYNSLLEERNNRSKDAQRGYQGYDHRSPRKTRHSSMNYGQYGNMVKEPMRMPATNKLPIIIGAVIVLILAFVVIKFVLPSGSSTTNTTSENKQVVSGLTDPEKSGVSTSTQKSTATVTPIAPTAAVFSYEVSSGASTYIELYIDGATKVAETVSGPAHQSYDITGEMKFVTSNPGPVKLTVGGKSVEPTEEGGSGVYVYTLKFSDYLAQWKAENNQS